MSRIRFAPCVDDTDQGPADIIVGITHRFEKGIAQQPLPGTALLPFRRIIIFHSFTSFRLSHSVPDSAYIRNMKLFEETTASSFLVRTSSARGIGLPSVTLVAVRTGHSLLRSERGPVV